MSVADSYVYDGFNLDLLLGTQAQSQNGTAYLSSINAVAQQKKKAKTQRSGLAERIADTNALLLQMKQLHGAYTDLQNTCNEVTKLFNQEKLERTAYENRCKTLSERCAHQEGIIEEKTFIIEQLHGDEHKLSWTRQELVIITMQLAQCLRENNIKVHGKPMNILKDIAEFCSKAKIQFDKLTAKTPRNCKNVLQNVLNNSQSTQTVGLNESTKVFTSSQATQTGLVETSNQAIQCSAGMPKILNSSQATQTGSMETQNEGTQRLPKMLTSSQATQTVLIETYNQATQYTSTVVTRSTSTKDLEDNFNSFVKPMRLSIGGQGNKLSKKCEPKNISKTYGVKTTAFVGPQLPEAMPKLDYRQILNEMLISYVPNPLTPIDPLPLLSVGTCTNLCNVHREIDYLCPHMPMIIKRSNSRPASPASNIKDEPFAANTSYEHSNIAKQILNSLPHSDSCLSSVPPNEFTELWRVFGERVLSLLQRRTHPEQKNTPAGFSNWLYELYVITQAEVVPVVAEFDKSPCLPNVMKTANLEKDSENDLETAVNFVSKLNVFRQPANYESELDAEERCLLGFMDTKEKDVYKPNSSNNEQEFSAEICHKGSTSVEFEQVDFNKRDESEKEVPLNGKRNEEKSVRGQLQAADAKKCKKRKRITRKAAKAKKRKIFDYEPNNEFEQRITNNQYSRLNDTTVSPKQIMQTEQTTETRPSVIDFYNAHKKTTRDFGQDSDSDIESAKVNIQYTCKPKIPDLCSSNTKDEFEIQSIEATGSPQTKEQSQQATDIAKNFKLLSLKSLTQPYVIDSYDRYKKITTDLGLNSDSDIDSDEINIPSTSTAEVSELSSTDTKVSGFSPSDVKASVSLKTKKEYQQSTQRIKKLKLSSRKSETQRSVICSYDEYKKIRKDLGLNSDSNIEFGEVNIQSTSTAEVSELCSSYTRAETDKYLMQPCVIDSCEDFKKIAADLDLSSDSDIESDEVNMQSTSTAEVSELCSSNNKAETNNFQIQSITDTDSPKTKNPCQQTTPFSKKLKLSSTEKQAQLSVIGPCEEYKKIAAELVLSCKSDIESDEVAIQSTCKPKESDLCSTNTKAETAKFEIQSIEATGSPKTKEQSQRAAGIAKNFKLSLKSLTKPCVIEFYDKYKKITTDLGLNSDSDIESDEINIPSTSTAEVSELCSSYTRAETDNYLMQPCVIDSCEEYKKMAADFDLSSDSDIESDEVNMQSISTAEVSELCSYTNKAETDNFQIQSITATNSPKTQNPCQQTTPFSKKLKLSSTEKQAQLSVIGPCEEYKKIAAELVLSCKSDIESDEVAIQSTCKPKESDLCSTNTKAETAKFEIQSIEATGSPKTKEQSQRAAGIAKNFKLSLKSLTKPCVIEFYDKYKKITTDLGLNSDSDIESDEINIPSTSTAEVSELCSSYTRAETDNYLMQPCVIDSCEEYKKMAADFDLSSDSDIESDEVNMQSISTAEVSELCSYTNKAETDNFQIQSITATNSPKTQNPCQQTTPMSKKLKLSSTEKQAQLSVIGPCEEYRKIANDSAIESDEVTIQSTNKEYVSDLYLSNTKSETDKSQIHSIKNQACDRLNDLEGTDSSDEKISTALESESDSGIESYSVHIQSTNKPVISQTDKFNIQSTKYKACDKLNELNCTDSYNAYEKINAVLDLESDYDIEPNEVHTQTINKPELTCGSKKFDIYNFETNRHSDRMKVNKERHSYDSDHGILDISTNVVFQDLILSDSDNEQKFKNGQPFSNPPSPEPDRLVIDDSDSDAEEELLSTETNSMQNPAASKPSHLEVEPTGEPVIRFGMQNTSEANCDEQQVIHLPCLGYFREAADEIRNCDNVLEPNELSYKTSKVTCPFDDSIVLGDLQETANISINCDNILEPNEPRKETAKEVCSFDYSPASPLAQLTDDQKFITVPEEVALGQRSETKALIVHTTDIVKKERRGRPKILITQADEIKQKMLTKTIAEFLKQSPDVPSTCIDFVVTLDSTTKKEVVIINAFINAFRTLDVKDNEVLRLQPAIRHFELKKLDFLQRFIEALDERLFCVKDKPNRKQAHNFVKLYLLLIDVQASNTNSAEYKNPARLFMAKILYHYKVDMPLLINEIVNKYPTVLPHRDERHYDNSDPLITVIKHLLMTHKYNMTDPLGADRCLLNMLRFNYYHFMQYAPTKEQVLENLVEKLKAGKLQDLCFAFALFCKRAITLQVTSSVLGSNLMPLASSYCELSLESDVYDERLEAALTSISMIVKQQPLSTDVSSYMALFKRTLMAAPRPRPEEAAVRAILRLQRFGFNMCESALQNYKPNYELTAMTRSMWASFVRRYRQYRLNANKK